MYNLKVKRLQYIYHELTIKFAIDLETLYFYLYLL